MRTVKYTAIILLLAFLLLQGGAVGVGTEPSACALLRLHVRANSNSPEDQALKYLVRDRVLLACSEFLNQAKNAPEAEQLLEDRLAWLCGEAQSAVNDAGKNYEIKILLGEASFPTRLYGDRVYRAGRYRALQINIGDGRGENWWCVLFPPLCFVEVAGDSSVPVTPSGCSPPRPKSRLLEWWRRCVTGHSLNFQVEKIHSINYN